MKTARPPENVASEVEKKAYYEEQASKYQWHFVHQKDGGFYYFVSRPAPSLYGKRMGIGGFFRSPDQLNIVGFREDFHTFKMKPDDLQRKGAVLFEKLVNREDLSSYYHDRKTEKEEWIEFPDPITYYDSTSQSWKMK